METMRTGKSSFSLCTRSTCVESESRISSTKKKRKNERKKKDGIRSIGYGWRVTYTNHWRNAIYSASSEKFPTLILYLHHSIIDIWTDSLRNYHSKLYNSLWNMAGFFLPGVGGLLDEIIGQALPIRKLFNFVHLKARWDPEKIVILVNDILTKFYTNVIGKLIEHLRSA